jgi:hypothetical protein
MGYRCWAAAGVLATALAGGCGGGKPEAPPLDEVEGTVLLNGKPLNKAAVRFQPTTDYGPEYLAVGVTDDKGRFKLTCKGQPGACSGENHVAVAEGEIPREYVGESQTAQRKLREYLDALGNRPIPTKYGNFAESPLKVNVTADKKEYTLELKREP